MVNDSAQLYTIEGMASAVLIMTTAYLVLSSTTILTPGETHINDLQLEQIGYDALAIMDIPQQYGEPTQLSSYIQTNDKIGFRDKLREYLNTKAVGADTIDFSASIWYLADDGSEKVYDFDLKEPYRQNTVKVTRWVILRDAIKDGGGNPVLPDMQTQRARIILLEVLLWRN